MTEHNEIRKIPIILTFIVGLGLIIMAICLDNNGKRKDILPSVFLEIGASIGLMGVLYLIERRFLREVKRDNQATVERVADIVESANSPVLQNEVKIDVVQTATDQGQQPKILIRITDPHGDYTTHWSVTLKSPSGKTETLNASWPGAGKIFRARFPTNEPRSGEWSGEAIKNGKDKHKFSAILSL